MSLQHRKFVLPPNAEASNEALIVKKPTPVFLGIADINDSIRKLNGGATKFILTFFEYGASNIKYAVYTPQGLLIKKYKYREDLKISFDELISLRQFYYDVHAYIPDGIFNILDIFVEPLNSDGSKIKVQFRVCYNESIDSSGGATHLSSGKVASFKGLDNANFTSDSFQHQFVTQGENFAGFNPLQTK